MKKKVAIIAGDGIGKEVVGEALIILAFLNKHFQLAIEYDFFPWNADYYLKHKKMLTDDDIKNLTENYSSILFGAIGDSRIPSMIHGRELLLKLRQECNLYVNFRPVRSYSSQLSPLKEKLAHNIDITIFRENTQGLYSQVGGSFLIQGKSTIAIDQSVYTQETVQSFIEYAFRWATLHDKKKIDLVDKANAICNTGKLWRSEFQKVAINYPQIETANHYIDSYCQKMLLDPQSIDVVVTSNLFGDILGDLGAALVGGLGLAESANINPESRFALFEPVHGSAPDIVGKGIANPVATFYAINLMLNHFDFTEASELLRCSLDEYLKNDHFEKTPDLGGNASTTQVTEQVIELMNKRIKCAEKKGNS